MSILILIDVQYTHKAVFSFEKGLNCQNHSSSGSLHPVKNSPQENLWFPPLVTAIWKTLGTGFVSLVIPEAPHGGG